METLEDALAHIESLESEVEQLHIALERITKLLEWRYGRSTRLWEIQQLLGMATERPLTYTQNQEA